MHMINTASVYRETYFVFVMPVFSAELGKHGVETKSSRIDVNYIHMRIPSFALYSFHMFGISCEDCFAARVFAEAGQKVPAFIFNASSGEKGGNVVLLV